MTKLNPEAEGYISKMLDRTFPYTVSILDNDFVISDNTVYPSGKVAAMLSNFLIENNLIQNKTIADIGAGCFALGIICMKNGAKMVLGTDINANAIECAKQNMRLNNITKNVHIFHGNGLNPLFPTYVEKIDLILCNSPWDSISQQEYEKITHTRKGISRAFYDVEDELMNNLMSRGFDLLSPKGRIFTTSCMRSIKRIQQLCTNHKLRYSILDQKDIHNDGNLHYILEVARI